MMTTDRLDSCGNSLRFGRWLLLAAAMVALASFPVDAYDAIESYDVRSLEDWTVRVHRQLLRQKDLTEDTLRLLEFQLYQIGRTVPSNAVVRLREIPIWVEMAHPRHPCMCYHPSAEWLREHDMNPAKAGSVEIANATNFLAWTKQQPWMVLHELAHGYHHKVIGHGHRGLVAAFNKAVSDQTYEQVLHWNGKTVRHYALNNEQEYFAERTEAFFGTNDYFPFTRPELKRHDPVLFELLGRLWGVTSSKPK